MNLKKMSLSVLLVGMMAAIIVALPSCKDSKKNETEKTLTEKVVGKWTVTGSYEKQNGKWVSIFGANDAGWYDFKADGTVSAYQRLSGNEQEAEMEWHVDNTTGEFYLVKDNKKSFPGKVVFENDDQFAIHYTTNRDAATGQTYQGEFKDVLQRDKK